MRRWTLLAVIAATPALVGLTWPGAMQWLCARGVRHYHAEKYEAAEASFRRALELSPGTTELAYNRGAALYRLGHNAEAAEAFAHASEGGGEDLRADAAYNLANARYRDGDFAAAIEAYRQALRLRPDDMQAKHNLELAQQARDRQQSESGKQEEQPGDDQQSEQQQHSGDDEQAQEQPSQRQQSEEEQADRQQAQQRRQEQGEQARSGEEDEQGELSAARARRLIRALSSEDAEMQRIIRRSPRRTQTERGQKDW